jgi:hypothetical protein
MSYDSLLHPLMVLKKSSKTSDFMLHWLRPQEDNMSASFKNVLKRTALFASIVGVGFSQMGCGGDDPVNPEPGPGTGSSTGAVHSIKGKITGLTVNVVDSTISIRTGGFNTPAEILLSAKKNTVGGKVKLDAPLLAKENLIREVGKHGLIEFKQYDKSLTVSSAEEGKKNIGYGINNNDKIDILDAEGINPLAANIRAGDRDTYQVTLEEIVAILNQPLKVIGAEAKGIGGAEKKYKIALN